MTWAELQIPMPPPSGNADLDAWLINLANHSRNYLGAYHHRGDPAAVDFDQTDLTMDTNWYDLDFSSIVDENTKLIALHILITDNNVGANLRFRKNGNSNGIVFTGAVTQVANVPNYGDIVCACDADRKIEYRASEALTTVTIAAIGWFK